MEIFRLLLIPLLCRAVSNEGLNGIAFSRLTARGSRLMELCDIKRDAQAVPGSDLHRFNHSANDAERPHWVLTVCASRQSGGVDGQQASVNRHRRFSRSSPSEFLRPLQPGLTMLGREYRIIQHGGCGLSQRPDRPGRC